MAVMDEGGRAPLGKPAGSVRAYLAMGIVGSFAATHAAAAAWLLQIGRIEAAIGLLGALALEAGTVTGFYFGSRGNRANTGSA